VNALGTEEKTCNNDRGEEEGLEKFATGELRDSSCRPTTRENAVAAAQKVGLRKGDYRGSVACAFNKIILEDSLFPRGLRTRSERALGKSVVREKKRKPRHRSVPRTACGSQLPDDEIV